MSCLSVEDLAIGYENLAVAEHISFQVNHGDYLCIVGENGAGKSTLVKTLLHLQKPLSGKIQYEEQGIGYLPQQTAIQKDFPASVWEIVLSGCLAGCGGKPFYGKADKALAKTNMEKMQIWDLRKKCFRNLSGGQQQRVLLARALCSSSEMLFLDEPASGLDPKVTIEMYELLEQLHKEKKTIIMVSHDMQAAMTYATHILHVGKNVTFYGTLEEYKNQELSIAFRLDAKREGDK